MKNLIIYLLLFINSHAFSQISYSGKVINKNKEPIEFVDIILLKNDKIIKGTVTNEKGEFEIIATNGNYVLKVNFLGYKNWEKKIILSQNSQEHIIKLEESNQQIEEVQIEASKNTFKRKADRLIFDVKNSLIGKSNGDIPQLLNFTPSVVINDENIQILGKEGVIVLINGRNSKLQGTALMAFLRSMKATDIDSIEIINTPPAKYDAEGNVALINIVTKKKEIDFWNSNITASHRQGFYGSTSTNASFNYNKNKIFFSSNITYENGKKRGEEKNTIFYTDNLWNQKTDYAFEKDLLTTNISSEYKINSNWLIGAQYIGNFNTPNSTNNGDIEIEGSSNNISKINNSGEELGNSKLNGLNFHSIINVTSSRIINIDFDYFDYSRDQNSIINSIQTVGNNILNTNKISNTSSQNISNFSSQVDVEYPIKNIALNFGGKISFSKTNNDVFISGVVNFDQKSQFTYNEDIQALYASLGSSFGLTEWSFKSGLRMERTETTAHEQSLNNQTKNDYLNFFPTVYINYKPNQYHNFSFDYSRRINRPVFYALNPFRTYTSPFSYSEGNPNLLPALSSNITFSHLYKNFLSTEIYFSQTDNSSGQIAVLNNNDLTQSITRLNYFNSSDIGLTVNYLYRKKKWWQSLNTFQFFYSESNSKIFPLTPKSITGIGAVLKTTNHFTLDKKQKSLIGFDFTYRTPNTSKHLIYNYDQYILNAFVKHSINNNLDVSLSLNNILREFNFNNLSTRNNINAIYNGYYDTQYLKFSINYNFGNRKVRQTSRNMSNTEEKNRAQ